MAEHAFVSAHVYNERGYPLLEGEQGRTSMRVRSVIRDMLFLDTADTDPRAPSTDYYVKDGESLQFLAFKFFGDPKRWHELASLNTHVVYPLDFKVGDVLKVPA